MNTIRTPEFSAELETLAGLAKAMAHPARLRILQILAESRACICGDLVDRLPLAQATVSQHLRVLREAGLIRGEISGPRTCYCLDSRAVAALRSGFAVLWDELGCCTVEGDCHDR